MTLNGEYHHALALLARGPNGHTETLVLLHACTRQLLNSLIRAKFAMRVYAIHSESICPSNVSPGPVRLSKLVALEFNSLFLHKNSLFRRMRAFELSIQAFELTSFS